VDIETIEKENENREMCSKRMILWKETK